jgi:hypothetical protein
MICSHDFERIIKSYSIYSVFNKNLHTAYKSWIGWSVSCKSATASFSDLAIYKVDSLVSILYCVSVLSIEEVQNATNGFIYYLIKSCNTCLNTRSAPLLMMSEIKSWIVNWLFLRN